ncbi:MULTISPECIES: hypothetical protein [unclassified Exiguobacterium]|uniref:hypothetical protein n=1 Tax=unclassified Exiguobacterium TaxID=2644629 RepID=UPI001BE7C351|nr:MULTISPECIES: hypothetical protein [unclassified Exiguobacterium]
MDKRAELEQEIRDLELLWENPLILYKNDYLHLVPHSKTPTVWNELWLYAKRRQLVKYYSSIEGQKDLQKQISSLKKLLTEQEQKGA